MKDNVFAELSAAPVGGKRPGYQASCGYLHADGTVTKYAVGSQWELYFPRAVATALHSCAKRLRAHTGFLTGDAKKKVVAALLMVTDEHNAILWKMRLDFPLEPDKPLERRNRR